MSAMPPARYVVFVFIYALWRALSPRRILLCAMISARAPAPKILLLMRAPHDTAMIRAIRTAIKMMPRRASAGWRGKRAEDAAQRAACQRYFSYLHTHASMVLRKARAPARAMHAMPRQRQRHASAMMSASAIFDAMPCCCRHCFHFPRLLSASEQRAHRRARARPPSPVPHLSPTIINKCVCVEKWGMQKEVEVWCVEVNECR